MPGAGLRLRGEGEAGDAHSAFDDAAEHIAKRLRRYRRRVNEHARDSANRERPQAARQYVLRQEDESEAADGESTAYATVIAESPTEIARLSVGDAVMRMDLADQKVLMFRNSNLGRAQRGLSSRGRPYRLDRSHRGEIGPIARRRRRDPAGRRARGGVPAA